MHISEPVITSLITVGKAFMVDSHKVLNGCVKVVHVDRVLGDVVTPIISLAMGDAALYTTAGKPDRKTARMMVSPESFGITTLAIDGATEFSTPDD